jgi:hypothetical protein
MIRFPRLWKTYFIITLSLSFIGLGMMASSAISGWELAVELIDSIIMLIGLLGFMVLFTKLQF